MALVELDSVEKRFGDIHALRGLSLVLQPGRIGLLGPNGAGKSTFLKSLLGLVRADSGTVRVFGQDVRLDPAAVRAQIGYMPEGDSVMPDLTAFEYTRFAGELCGLPRDEAIARAHQVLYFVGLGEARYRKLGAFSTGMKQRARLAQALVGDPKLLLLDEPTSGLDPRGRDEMLELVRDIPARTGSSVILSTHILPDVEKTCDQVVVMANGAVRYAGGLETLLGADARLYEVRAKGDTTKFVTELELEGCTVGREGVALVVRVPEGSGLPLILRCAESSATQLRQASPFVATLEHAFLRTLETPSVSP